MLYDPKRWDVKESETVTILRAARERIERGWCQNEGMDADGNVCALVALGEQFTYGQDLFRSEPMRLLREAARSLCIPEWNDAPGRTKSDVLAAYDRAIAAAR